MLSDKRDTALVGRHNNRKPRSAAGRQQIAAVVHSAGETPSRTCLPYRQSMPLGPTPCPKACAPVPPPRRFRKLSISTSIPSPISDRRGDLAVTASRNIWWETCL
jgi:hypothetical protein